MNFSAAFPFPADTTLSLGTRVNASMLAQQHETAASSLVRRGVSPLSATKPEYRCKFCPRTFKCPRALGGHQKAHKDLREALYKPPRHAWSLASNWRSSHATSVRRAFHAPQFIAWRIHYYHPFARSIMPSFPGQTGNGSLAPTHLSPSAPVVVDGYRGTGDGSNLGGLHEANQEETADGIDLTLKL